MKKIFLSAFLASLALGAQAAGDILKVAVFPTIAAVPVALAAEKLKGVEFVPVVAPDIVETIKQGKADCGVMPVGDAVALWEQLGQGFRVVSGLVIDKEQPRQLRSTVLGCTTDAAVKDQFDALSTSVLAQMSTFRQDITSERVAKSFAERAIKRLNVPDSGGIGAAIRIEVSTLPVISPYVIFSYVPLEVMYSAGAEGVELNKAEDVLFSDVRFLLKRAGRVAL